MSAATVIHARRWQMLQVTEKRSFACEACGGIGKRAPEQTVTRTLVMILALHEERLRACVCMAEHMSINEQNCTDMLFVPLLAGGFSANSLESSARKFINYLISVFDPSFLTEYVFVRTNKLFPFGAS